MYGQNEESVERSGTDSDAGAFVGVHRRHHHGHGKHRKLAMPTPGSQIATADFLAYATALAQVKAGIGRVPTAQQVSDAQTQLRARLQRTNVTVLGGEPTETLGHIKGKLWANHLAGTSSGSFWESVKSVAVKTAPILKSVIPGAAIAVPVAALTARSVSKSEAKKAQAAAPAAASAPAEEPAAPEGQTVSGAFVGIRGNKNSSSIGKFLFWGSDSLTAKPGAQGGTIKLSHKGAKNSSPPAKPISLPAGWSVDEASAVEVKGDGVMGFFGFGSKTLVPHDHEEGYVVLRHQGTKNSKPLTIPDSWAASANDSNTSISGRPAKITRNVKVMDSSGMFVDGDNVDVSKAVPQDVYRAEICRRAKLLCKGGKPTADCFVRAQASVHADMAKTGVTVAIPGAAPGRVTRGPSVSGAFVGIRGRGNTPIGGRGNTPIGGRGNVAIGIRGDKSGAFVGIRGQGNTPIGGRGNTPIGAFVGKAKFEIEGSHKNGFSLRRS